MRFPPLRGVIPRAFAGLPHAVAPLSSREA
jgi:hypothetical protein